MAEGRSGFGLQKEAPEALLIADAAGWKDFDRGKAIEVQIAGLVDDAHPALAQPGEDLVVRQHPPDEQYGIETCLFGNANITNSYVRNVGLHVAVRIQAVDRADVPG